MGIPTITNKEKNMARKNSNAGTRNREQDAARRQTRMHFDAKYEQHTNRAVLGPLSKNLVVRERVTL